MQHCISLRYRVLLWHIYVLCSTFIFKISLFCYKCLKYPKCMGFSRPNPSSNNTEAMKEQLPMSAKSQRRLHVPQSNPVSLYTSILNLCVRVSYMVPKFCFSSEWQQTKTKSTNKKCTCKDKARWHTFLIDYCQIFLHFFTLLFSGKQSILLA